MNRAARVGSWNSRLETRVRGAWAGVSAPELRLAAVLYGLGHDARDLLYEAGILTSEGMPIPVISVGGLTTGGSGKTPVSSVVAGWLVEGGGRPAVVTGGIPDEAAVHRLLNPDLTVIDQRDRRLAVWKAARSGAGAAVLDSGFQHRRIRSDMQVLCVDAGSALLPGRRRLPAGPFRERWSALERADAIVLVRRYGAWDPSDPESAEQALLTDIRRVAPVSLTCCCRLRPTGFRAANALAEGVGPSGGCVAVAGVMWPEPFFASLDEFGVPAGERLVYSDHEPYGPTQLDTIRSASANGVVCTLKDAVKLGPLLAEEVPVWYLEENVVWESGEEGLRRGVLRTAGVGPGRLHPSQMREE